MIFVVSSKQQICLNDDDLHHFNFCKFPNFYHLHKVKSNVTSSSNDVYQLLLIVYEKKETVPVFFSVHSNNVTISF